MPRKMATMEQEDAHDETTINDNEAQRDASANEDDDNQRNAHYYPPPPPSPIFHGDDEESLLVDHQNGGGERQRRHHLLHHTHTTPPRRHSYPAAVGGLGIMKEEDGITTAYVQDHDACIITSTAIITSWEKDDDDDDGCGAPMISTTTATSPLISSHSTVTSIPVPAFSTSTAHTNTTHVGQIDTTTTTTATPTSNQQKKQPSCNSKHTAIIPLSSLPIDALQAISTYCTPSDWHSLSSTSQHWRYGLGSEVFGRVRRHAGLCAFEVAMAWVSLLLPAATTCCYSTCAFSVRSFIH